MPTEPENPPAAKATKAERAAAQRTARRAALEAAALRANLSRRKAQSRARKPPVPEDAPCR
jgi:hypothetical protein